jgi:hypothetical protein
MKAERRHELQTNTLSQFLTDLPLYLRFHANKILIGVIVLCLVVLLVRHRLTAAREAKEATRAALVSVRSQIQQIEMADRSQTTEVARSNERAKMKAEINDSIDRILQGTEDPADSAIRADAMILRGDMYWTLANLPGPTTSTSQPSVGLSQPSAASYLDSAQAAYDAVLSKYASQQIAKASALFGLAAIEENRRNWDKASAYYTSITTDAGIAQVFKDMAGQRARFMPQMRAPMYMGNFSSTQPTTEPSTQAASESSTRPTTQTMAAPPTTRPL